MKHEGAFDGSNNTDGGEWDMTPPAEDETLEDDGEKYDREPSLRKPGDALSENEKRELEWVSRAYRRDKRKLARDGVPEDEVRKSIISALGYYLGVDAYSVTSKEGDTPTEDEQARLEELCDRIIETEKMRGNLLKRIMNNEKVKRIFVGALAVTAALIVAMSMRGGQTMVDEPTKSPSSGIEMVDYGVRPQEQDPGDSVDENMYAPVAPSSPSRSETTPPDSGTSRYSEEIRFYRPDAGGGGGNFGKEASSEEAAQVERVKEAIRSDSKLAKMLEDEYGITADSLDGAITTINLDVEPTIELATPEE